MAGNPKRIDDSFTILGLKVIISVIGYENIGESIVVFLQDGDTIIYTMVIDSYLVKRKNQPILNKTIDLLRQNHVERIDTLCWTHPHRDHSRGMLKLISDYCDSETLFIFPAYLTGPSLDNINLKNDELQMIQSILTANRDKSLKANQVAVVTSKYTTVDEFKLTNYYGDIILNNIRIVAVTPDSSELLKQVGIPVKRNPNDLSVSLVLLVDSYGFLFGADTTNKHIDTCNKELLKKCRFVKIPHHASPTANHLVSHLPSNLDAACTTLYNMGNAHLPDDNVIRQYKAMGTDVYVTGNKNRQKSGILYRIMTYIYDFSGSWPKISLDKSYCPVLL